MNSENGRYYVVNISVPVLGMNTTRTGILETEDEFLNIRLYSFISLGVLNIALHSLGSLLLFQTLKQRKQKPQHYYLINLALTEVLKNCTIELQVFFKLIVEGSSASITTCQNLFWFTTYVSFTSMYYLYFSAMFFITNDRLLAVTKNIQYRFVWNIHRTKVLIIGSWCISLLIVLPSFTIVYFVHGVHDLLGDILLYYIPTILNVVYLGFAAATYLIMFRKYISSRRLVRKKSKDSSVFNMFRQSKFFVSVLLIASFLVLTVVPYLIIFICNLNGTVLSKSFYIYSNTCILLGDTLDAIIYIFTYIPVSRLLKRRVKSAKCWFVSSHLICWSCFRNNPIEHNPETQSNVRETFL